MILSVQSIRRLVHSANIISPKPSDNSIQYQPASYDIRIGFEARTSSGKLLKLDTGDELVICKTTFQCYLERIKNLFTRRKVVHYCTSVTLQSYERLNVPIHIAATVLLRTSSVRSGLVQSLAGYIDPGYSGNLALEMTSSRTVYVKPLLRVAQIVFYVLDEATITPYGSGDRNHYQHQTSPQGVAVDALD